MASVNNRTNPTGYTLPRPPRWQGGWNIRSLFGALLSATTASWASTEWVAWKLEYPAELGRPLFVYHGLPFQPVGALALWLHFAGSHFISPNVRTMLWEGFGFSVIGALVASWLTYWFLSLIRDRNSNRDLVARAFLTSYHVSPSLKFSEVLVP